MKSTDKSRKEDKTILACKMIGNVPSMLYMLVMT